MSSISDDGSWQMHAGDHFCCIYRTDDERRGLAIDFVRAGVERREKVPYLVDLHDAERAGQAALRVTGEMSRALAGDLGCERLTEYEAKLNEFFPRSRCMAPCPYDRRCFDAKALLDVLYTHPFAMVGTRAYDNRRMYYEPRRAFLAPNRPAAILDRALTNLVDDALRGEPSRPSGPRAIDTCA